MNGADIGVAFDGDGDRLVVLTEQGKIIDPILLGLVYAKQQALKHKSGAYVAEKKLFFIEDALKSMGLTPIFVDTGRPNIKAAINENQGLGGYELSGHIYDSKGYDDGLRNMLRLIETCSQRKMSISSLIDEAATDLPYYSPEIRFAYDKDLAKQVIESLQQQYGCEPSSDITIKQDNAAMYIRTSSHEPKVTVVISGKTKSDAEEMKENVLSQHTSFLFACKEKYNELIAQRAQLFYTQR
jgi:phosphomannomutase/phosphoglucomutase